MTDELPYGAETPAELVERYTEPGSVTEPVRDAVLTLTFHSADGGPFVPGEAPYSPGARKLIDAIHRDVHDQWVAAGRPTASPRPKPLRLRIEPEGPAGPGWLSLLALIGWMKGVVTWETGPWTP